MSARPEQTQENLSPESREARIHAILDERKRRSPTRAPISDVALISAHPDLMPELGDELRKLRLIAVARERAAQSTSSAADTCSQHESDTDSRQGTATPERFGRYRVERLIGRGGFGAVYQARDEELNRLVAIKVTNLPNDARPVSPDTYATEARALASLEHPNILPVYDIGISGTGQPFVVSKLINGCDLAKWLQSKLPTPDQAVTIVAKISEAAHAAHKNGLVHRDIKPANILLDETGTPYLADFGLALHENAQRMRAGEFAGTLPYMAPEQVRGDAQGLDGRADIWALGVVLYELLTGRRPFNGCTSDEIRDEILNRNPKPPRQIVDMIPMELERICLRCLAKDVLDRYTTAKDLASDLITWFEQFISNEFSLAATAGWPPKSSPVVFQYVETIVASLERQKGVANFIPLAAQLAADTDCDPTANEQDGSLSDQWGLDAPLAMLDPDLVQCDAIQPFEVRKRQLIPIRDVVQVIDRYSCFVILGEPGAGKTTIIRRIALDLARQWMLQPEREPIPFLINLSNWIDDVPFMVFLRGQYEAAKLPPADLAQLLKTGKVVLLLDGLNEMGRLHTSHTRQLKQAIHEKTVTKAVITCRSDGYRAEVDLGLPTVIIQKMDDETVKRFATSYLGELAAAEFIEHLKASFDQNKDNRSLYDVAHNPFLLTALLVVYAGSKDATLPRNSGELVNRLVAVLWERERLRNTVGWTSHNEMATAASNLALAMIEHDLPSRTSVEFALDYLGSRPLLDTLCGANLLDTDQGRIAFSHPLFQEYFAAIALPRERVGHYVHVPEASNWQRIRTKWDQVIVIKSVIEQDADGLVDSIAKINPLLAVDCERSGAIVTAQTRQSIFENLQALRRRPDPQLRAATTQSLADFAFDKVVEELAGVLDDDNTMVRAIAAQSLGKLGDPKAIPYIRAALKNTAETRLVRRQLIDALSNMGQGAVRYLIDLLRDRDDTVREAAAHGLLTIGKPAVRGLLRSLHSRDADVCVSVAELLGQMGDPLAIAGLTDRLSDTRKSRAWGGERVCDVAAEALAEIGTPEALAALTKRPHKAR